MAVISAAIFGAFRSGRYATRSMTTARMADPPAASGKRREGKVELLDGVERQERPDHEDVAVGEVDEAHDAIDHRVPQGDQGVHEAQL